MNIENWGEVDYSEAVQGQLDSLELVALGDKEDTLIFCSHPPVVTLGRSTPDSDLKTWRGDTIKASRGGRATYHGPGQLVVYPIIDLKRERGYLVSRDVTAYLRHLEKTVVEVLGEFSIEAHTRSDKLLDDEGQELLTTGVWVGERKIASVGVAVKKWVTYHGVAINITRAAASDHGIRPCGFSPETMISVEECTEKTPDLRASFAKIFES